MLENYDEMAHEDDYMIDEEDYWDDDYYGEDF
ncbi:hypothetical protein SAMN05216454_10688 [Peptostreptococcus russellii]|uniref:Uncharacterized protein n=1 Tax=Peptostreptococcus russellii TaxID=215200 RepID=A0A1H8HUY1_9FIRM|nr:hypothetical protein SAMN05216454_10688 [Peptostreptococcus russellii]